MYLQGPNIAQPTASLYLTEKKCKNKQPLTEKENIANGWNTQTA